MIPHELLDAAMNDRRLEMRMTWSDLAKAAGTSDVTLRAIRRGDNQPSSLTKRRIEDALQWGHGSIDAILAGSDPVPLKAQRPEQEPTVAELAAEVARLTTLVEKALGDKPRDEGLGSPGHKAG